MKKKNNVFELLVFICSCVIIFMVATVSMYIFSDWAYTPVFPIIGVSVMVLIAVDLYLRGILSSNRVLKTNICKFSFNIFGTYLLYSILTCAFTIIAIQRVTQYFGYGTLVGVLYALFVSLLSFVIIEDILYTINKAKRRRKVKN